MHCCTSFHRTFFCVCLFRQDSCMVWYDAIIREDCFMLSVTAPVPFIVFCVLCIIVIVTQQCRGWLLSANITVGVLYTHVRLLLLSCRVVRTRQSFASPGHCAAPWFWCCCCCCGRRCTHAHQTHSAVIPLLCASTRILCMHTRL